MLPVLTHTSSGSAVADDADLASTKDSYDRIIKLCEPDPALKPHTNGIYGSLITFVLDESLSTIPIFMRYFAFHECVVLICGAMYYVQPDIGAVCISIVPGLSIMSMFVHFLRTQFPTHREAQRAFWRTKHYAAAMFVFVCGAMSICAIYKTNTFLSTLIPSKVTSKNTNLHQFIRHILEFPHRHSFAVVDAHNRADIDANYEDEFSIFDANSPRPFNYRLSFVGSIIAPIIEETSKFLLLALTFPMSFLWRFSRQSNASSNEAQKYAAYCRDSLFLMFIALCGGCGIAIMENIGYLAACQWPSTRAYCLPNKNIDILGAGLARGIFSVPFHCVTACILADTLCAWMHCDVVCLRRRHWLKLIASYPMAMVLPVLLHSSFNFWMKGLPFVTGVVTIVGFGVLAIRIAHKHGVVNSINSSHEQSNEKGRQGLWYGGHRESEFDEVREPAVAL